MVAKFRACTIIIKIIVLLVCCLKVVYLRGKKSSRHNVHMTAFREGISQILGLADEDESGAHWLWEGLNGVNRQPSNGSESNRQRWKPV